MLGQPGPRGRVECAHGDADPVKMRRIEEETGAAGRTETTVHFVRGRVPCDVVRARYSERRFCDIGGRLKMTSVLAADRTVARYRIRQVASDCECDSAAETGSVMGHLGLNYVVSAALKAGWKCTSPAGGSARKLIDCR